MTHPHSTDPVNEFSGRYVYIVVCVAALGLLLMLQLSRPETVLSRDVQLPLNPILCIMIGVVGGLGVSGHLRSAPILILLLMALPMLVGPINNSLASLRVFGPRSGFNTYDYYQISPLSLLDVLTSAALLTFTIGHYRLLSLAEAVLPVDARLKRTSPAELRKPWRKRRPKVFKRSEFLVSPNEIGLLLLGVPMCAAMAQLLWWLVAVDFPVLSLSQYTVRFLLVGWFIVVPGLVVSGCFRLWRQTTMSEEEAALILQDSLWQETRREQRRIQQWLVWRSLKSKPGKENT